MKTGRNIITRLLPKTGQITEYVAGDDGTHEAGWWKGRLNSNNLTRWIQKTIGGDDIVLDRATGLMWAADGNAAGCCNGIVQNWGDAITYADIILNFAGFDDWRLPNMKELVSILDGGVGPPRIAQPPFSNTVSDEYWSSTTDPSVVTRALTTQFDIMYTMYRAKTEEHYIRCVRKGL